MTREDKLRCTPKAKLDIYVEMPLQTTPENSIEERIVMAADSGASSVPLEKRKEDAGKILYLKRV